jgi:uncharacterized membrane protein YgdD (TMEM256/DUF423 family)
VARAFLLVAALYGAAGVALGAFGAHGLRSRLSGDDLAVWQTAVSYHLVHALALLSAGLWLRIAAADAALHTPLAVSGWSFVAGVLLFSGSLYLLALGGPKWLGPVTPLGGVAFILGWLALAWAALRVASVAPG